MEHTFERLTLYEEVWSTPLTRLGKKYGMSDNGIRKICNAMNIPLPQAGHWAKIAAGTLVPRVSLPPDTDRVRFESYPPARGEASVEDVEDATWLKQRENFEQQPENKVVVSENVARWHPIVREIRRRMIECVKEAEKHKKDWERQQAIKLTSKRPRPDFDSWAWQRFDSGGQILELGRRFFPLRVSLRTWERSLCILQALVVAAELRGFSVKHEGEKPQLTFSIDGAEIYFRMSEKTVVSMRKVEASLALDDLLGPRYIKVATGELRVFVAARGAETKFEESASNPLEMQMNQVLIRLFRKVVHEKRCAREIAERHRQWEEERLAREKLEARRQEALRLASEEAARRRELIEEAKAWQEAKLVRAYLEEIESLMNANPSDSDCQELTQWLNWAQQVAEEIDPTTMRVS